MAHISFKLKQTVPFDGDRYELAIIKDIGTAYRSTDDHEKLRLYHRAMHMCGAATLGTDDLLDRLTSVIRNKFNVKNLAESVQILLNKLHGAVIDSPRDSDAYCLTTLLSACIHCKEQEEQGEQEEQEEQEDYACAETQDVAADNA